MYYANEVSVSNIETEMLFRVKLFAHTQNTLPPHMQTRLHSVIKIFGHGGGFM